MRSPTDDTQALRCAVTRCVPASRSTVSLPPPGCGRSGFTLIELVAVMVMVSIVGLVVIVPSMSDLTTSRQSGAATRVLHDIHAARQRAMARGTRLWVVFDADSDRYDVYVEPAGSPGRANRIPLVDPATGNEVGLQLNEWPYAGSGIDAIDVAGGTEIGFDYLGRALTEGEQILTQDGTVTLTGGHTLTIAARTGHVYE
ncbi:MAG: prepilin-type N-terminal cleavage/methylation domain-containing protein [Planctomycetes bacterium]|nr:prepilin-type N-terminal cleavage/methylation domain-containing protein [Planctomycetota bacterium]NOG54676.1 prepilin-type N-terminal cleavage/methylation domain-containing protein [Planctomycetota bacterium]